MMVDGAPFDIGGGHFLDVRNPKVNAFLFSFMPESEWVQYKKICKIMIEGAVIDYPFEANIWELPAKEQVEYLKSIAVAGCNRGDPMPERFVSWIYWKLGDKIAKNYMIPYNEKLYGGELDRLGTYWLEKLPNVSFEETLISCLEKRPYGKHPGHVRFYYPREYGYGEIWRRMAEQIGGHIEYGKIVKAIDFNSKIVTTADGERYRADTIITTIPWMEFTEIVGMPESIQNSIQELKFSSIQTKYHAENLDTKAHWIYCSNPALSYHRILVRHNFCRNSRGYWTETNSERTDDEAENTAFQYMNRYAYPLNTINKPEIMKKLLTFSRARGVIGLGRWGEHQHYNSDVTVGLAMKLAAELEG